MSGIPQVKRWRVSVTTDLGDCKALEEFFVDAPTQRFARWAVRDHIGWARWAKAEKITLSVWRDRR